MQLVNLSKALKPITLSTALGVLPVAHAFSYSDIDFVSSISINTANSKTSEYIKTVDNKDFMVLMHKLKFQNHLAKWERAVIYLSSAKSIIENLNFQAIISMGHTAVPFIVEEIEKKPSILVWALNIIFDQKITNDQNATITDACKLWVKALKQ